MHDPKDLADPDYTLWRLEGNLQDFTTGLVNYGEWAEREARIKREAEEASNQNNV